MIICYCTVHLKITKIELIYSAKQHKNSIYASKEYLLRGNITIALQKYVYKGKPVVKPQMNMTSS